MDPTVIAVCGIGVALLVAFLMAAHQVARGRRQFVWVFSAPVVLGEIY